MMSTYPLLRDMLFRLEPETAHSVALAGLSLAHRLKLARFMFGAAGHDNGCELMGLKFRNRVGLAAGYDKNADYVDQLAALGFGFIEVGTVTPRPQPGNPRPRLFRLPAAKALINRMGFNNKGVDHLVARLRARKCAAVVGVNIGKNFDTPLERAQDDYLLCFERVYPVSDYIVVNVSSPNTPGLRKLQAAADLSALLQALREREASISAARKVPLLVKVAPDLGNEEIDAVAGAAAGVRLDGIIATNTTLGRERVAGLPNAEQTGGLSGAPLRSRATEVVARLRRALGGGTAIIASGGIMSGADAREKIAAGADLVQIYTGLIYGGPALIGEINQSLQSAARSV